MTKTNKQQKALVELEQELKKDAAEIKSRLKNNDDKLQGFLSKTPEDDKSIHFFSEHNGNLVEIKPDTEILGDDKYNLLSKNIPIRTSHIITRGKIIGDAINVRAQVYAGDDIELETSQAKSLFSGNNITINGMNDNNNFGEIEDRRLRAFTYARGEVFAGLVGDHSMGMSIIYAGKDITVLESQSELYSGGDIEIIGRMNDSAHAIGNIKAKYIISSDDELPFSPNIHAGNNITVKDARANMFCGGDIIFTDKKAVLQNRTKAQNSISVKNIDTEFFNDEETIEYLGKDALIAPKIYTTSTESPKIFKGELIHVPQNEWEQHLNKMLTPSNSPEQISLADKENKAKSL